MGSEIAWSAHVEASVLSWLLAAVGDKALRVLVALMSYRVDAGALVD
jgi:hypothetical protein